MIGVFGRANAPLTRAFSVLALTSTCWVSGAQAASFGELSAGQGAPAGYENYSAGPYAATAMQPCPPYACQPVMSAPGNAEGSLSTLPNYQLQPFVPAYQANPRAFLPYGPYGDQPNAQMQLWTFGQVNATTDPFNPWGLSTPYMFVPWSTPLSGWTNAQTWNWWRERSGALPRNW